MVQDPIRRNRRPSKHNIHIQLSNPSAVRLTTPFPLSLPPSKRCSAFVSVPFVPTVLLHAPHASITIVRSLSKESRVEAVRESNGTVQTSLHSADRKNESRRRGSPAMSKKQMSVLDLCCVCVDAKTRTRRRGEGRGGERLSGSCAHPCSDSSATTLKPAVWPGCESWSTSSTDQGESNGAPCGRGLWSGLGTGT